MLSLQSKQHFLYRDFWLFFMCSYVSIKLGFYCIKDHLCSMPCVQTEQIECCQCQAELPPPGPDRIYYQFPTISNACSRLLLHVMDIHNRTYLDRN